MKHIMYGIEPDGTVISRVGSEIAFPVLDFGAIGQGGDGFEPGDFVAKVRQYPRRGSSLAFLETLRGEDTS